MFSVQEKWGGFFASRKGAKTQRNEGNGFPKRMEQAIDDLAHPPFVKSLPPLRLCAFA
jgi:hypothetical protein